MILACSIALVLNWLIAWIASQQHRRTLWDSYRVMRFQRNISPFAWLNRSGNAPVTPARFFTSKEQEYSVMLPFMAEGFEAGDRLT
jgi:hypothetical protein